MTSFEARRRARGPLVGRVLRLGEESLVDDRDATTVDERLALVSTLTRELWAFAGRPIPDYTRENMPARIIRRP